MPGIEDLKPEDVVITSTPQSRRTEDPAPVADPPPAPAKPAEEKPKKEEEGKEEEEEGKEEEGEEEEEEGEEGTIEGELVQYDEDGNPIEPGEEEEEEEYDVDWDALSEEVGLEIDSNDTVVEALKELAEYKNLSPALQKAIEIEQNQGDVAAYFRSLATDPANLSDRDALWEQYAAENPKRIATNPKFARLDFDRKLDKEYSLLTEYENLSASEQEDFLSEHKADLEYLKEKRKFDAEAARATLREAREGATFYPPAKAQEDPAIQRMVQNHEPGYKNALSTFDVISIDIGGDFEFNVGISDSNRKTTLEWMKQPELFLKEMGFSKDNIDYETFAGWAALIADIKYGTFGERFRQAIIDNKDISTLESTLDAPGVTRGGSGKAAIQSDEWEAVGAAFEKQRADAKKRR